MPCGVESEVWNGKHAVRGEKMNQSARRPSAALIVALVALFAALAGGAIALPGSGTVDRNDLKRGAVTKKAIKRGAVTKKAIKDTAVTAPKLGPQAVTGPAIAAGAVSAEKLAPQAVTGPAIAAGAVNAANLASGSVTGRAIAAGAVSADKLAEHEPRHVVGTAGEPQFSNGGEGDCIWQDAGAFGYGHVSFYKDEIGYVRMSGFAIASDGPGGDGVCDLNDPGEEEDGIVFALPAAYVPSELLLTFGINGPTAITPAGGAIFGSPVPGGVVYADEGAFLTGITYEPASAASRAASMDRPPVDVSAVMRAAR
jgi:hypothetical protein